jgi:hypothetical protein
MESGKNESSKISNSANLELSDYQISDSGFAEFDILPDSFLSDFILSDSGLDEFDNLPDFFLPDSIPSDSGFGSFWAIFGNICHFFCLIRQLAKGWGVPPQF